MKRLALSATVVLVVTFMASGSAEARAVPSWAIQTTPNLHENASLMGTSCPSTTSCLAVGWNVSTDSSGSIVPLSERWTSSGWVTQVTPNPYEAASELLGVSCTSTTACTAVGFYLNSSSIDDTLAERWNGTSWSLQSSPNPTGAMGTTLYGVSCASSTACTAVGSYVNSASVTVTLAEAWNGGSWSIETTLSPTGATFSRLQGVSCKSLSSCEAVGYYNAGTASNIPFAERWSGSSWATQTVPTAAGATSSLLDGVSCSSSTACTAVGNYNRAGVVTLAERWNGSVWRVQSTPNPAPKGDRLFGVACPSSSVCVAVGQYPNTSAVNVTLAERWNGTTWAVQSTPNPPSTTVAQLSAVACKNGSTCTAVGDFDSPAFFWQQMLAERYS